MAERVILPLPRRRVAPGQDATSISPSTTAATASLSAVSASFPGLSLSPSQQAIYQAQAQAVRVAYESSAIYDSEPESEEEEDDDCSNCREWLDNAKNKKKRKIPTGAAMGHQPVTATAAAVIASGSTNQHHNHATPIRKSSLQRTPLSGGPSGSNPSRRRKTWDIGTTTEQSAAAPEGDFDFVCDSPVARNLPAIPPSQVTLPVNEPVDVGTQTTPTLAEMEPILPIRHRRTKEEKEFDRKMLVRRQRREARRKAKPGETIPIWVCQFCEFEDVFGYAPLALISGYDERIRAARRAALERKRLLEKARTRGKKKKAAAGGKKAGTFAGASPASSHPPGANGGAVQASALDRDIYDDYDAHLEPIPSIAQPSVMPPPTSKLPAIPVHAHDKGIGPGGCTCCSDPHML